MGYWAVFVDGLLCLSRLFRLTEGQNRINPAKFGSQQVRTELETEFFGFGSFGFGSDSFGSVFSSRLILPRFTGSHGFLLTLKARDGAGLRA
jgi:hypothetical protein